MTRKLHLTLEECGIEWPALRNHIPCMVHIIQPAVGAFMSSNIEKGRTKSWKAHEHDQLFRQNESTDIGMSQRLRKEGNARINKVSAMRPCLAKIIEKVRISRYFESPETDLHIAENAWSIDYADTWLLKGVHWLSYRQSSHCSTTYYICEDTSQLDTGVGWASLPITRIHPRVAPTFKIHWLPATLHNTGWMDHCQVHHGRLRPFRYWTMWMSNRHTVTLHHVLTVHNEMFDHMDGVMRALAEKKTQWTEDLFIAMNLARQMQSKYYAEVTAAMGMFIITAHILDPFRKLRLFWKWDKRMDIDPEDETSYTTQYQEAFLMYVEN